MTIWTADYLFDLGILLGLFIAMGMVGFFACKVLMEVWDWWTWR